MQWSCVMSVRRVAKCHNKGNTYTFSSWYDNKWRVIGERAKEWVSEREIERDMCSWVRRKCMWSAKSAPHGQFPQFENSFIRTRKDKSLTLSIEEVTRSLTMNGWAACRNWSANRRALWRWKKWCRNRTRSSISPAVLQWIGHWDSGSGHLPCFEIIHIWITINSMKVILIIMLQRSCWELETELLVYFASYRIFCMHIITALTESETEAGEYR